MNIQIICVGKLKEKYWKEALSEYIKRLERYCKITITEVKEELAGDKALSSEVKAVKDKEGMKIIGRIRPGTYVVSLDLEGVSLSSEELAEKMKDCGVKGQSDITFIIGGSLGLSKDVLDRSNMILSFSKLTFPHQMIRIFLLEQIYRSFKINRNENYHK